MDVSGSGQGGKLSDYWRLKEDYSIWSYVFEVVRTHWPIQCEARVICECMNEAEMALPYFSLIFQRSC